MDAEKAPNTSQEAAEHQSRSRRTPVKNPVSASDSVCSCTVDIDLADEAGIPKNLPSRLQSYASDFLAARGTFVPVTIDKDPEGQIIYTHNPDYRAVDGHSSSRTESHHGHKASHSPRLHDKFHVGSVSGRAVSPVVVERKQSRFSSDGTTFVSQSAAGHHQRSHSTSQSGSSSYHKKADRD